MEKVQSTLKQLVREWGAEGAAERDQAHELVLQALQDDLPPHEYAGARVLLPGAGLGRLTWEVARLGYRAQGCEFSYFMLLAANFMLNTCRERPSTVHPWVLQTCNARSVAEQTRAATVPDGEHREGGGRRGARVVAGRGAVAGGAGRELRPGCRRDRRGRAASDRVNGLAG